MKSIDTEDEERELVLGDQEDPGRVDESGDIPGQETDLEDIERV